MATDQGDGETMTRKQFEAKAIREAERMLGVPAGWWGTWQHVQGPGNVHVRHGFSNRWTIRQGTVLVSRHDSRSGAIAKASRLP